MDAPKMASQRHGGEDNPLTTIVTLALDDASQAWFEQKRQEYYPPAMNRIPAHLTLFHALPGDRTTRHVLNQAAEQTSPFVMQVEGLRSMGRGVLYALHSPELMNLHAGLVSSFRTFLTPQDKQPLRPHVVVQNKVEPQEAKALLAQLQEQFVAAEVRAEGLLWWEYLGGPWRLLERFAFQGQAVDTP
jgi:2'-5' RNA ligase